MLDSFLPSWADHERWEKHQSWIAQDILRLFREGNDLVVLNCPTGGGKTLIAEMVRRLMNVHGMYLCTTISLQHQFVGDFDNARLIKGRANYTPLDPEPDYKGTVPTCADCDFDPVGKYCSYCSRPNFCPYNAARDEAAGSELPCANTSYFMSEVQKGDRSLFAGRDLVILDEAHVAHQEVMRHVSVTITPRMQRSLSISRPGKKTVESSWVEWFNYAIPHITKKRAEIPADSLENRRFRERLERLLGKMRTVAQDLDGWIYNYDDSGTIEFKPITTNKIAPSALMKHGKKWLAMSATIVPEHFVASMGYEGSWSSVFAPSTFPKENRPIYFCPSAYMTKKNEAEAWPQMARALRAVLNRHPNERILVHAHSYGLTKYLHNALEDIERPVFSYLSSSQRDSAIYAYETTDNAVLIASSLAQGYDGKDDKCRVVVLCKVMFPSLGDKQVAARLHKTPDGELWYASITAEAVQQAVGRHVRHEKDHGVTYILDTVFSSFYGKWKWLFADWFNEAFHVNSEARFALKKATKESGTHVLTSASRVR